MQTEQLVRNGRVDFDFLMGSWHVQSRRLRERLKGSTTWEEFDGTVTARPILNGLGNFDEVIFNRVTGRGQGSTLRLFDVASQEWRIYWADGSHGTLDV